MKPIDASITVRENNEHPASNWDTARKLSQSGETGIRWGDWAGTVPRNVPSTVDIDDRVTAMMLGLAVGDALGNTSESLLPAIRETHHGWIDSYLPNWRLSNKALGGPSDDTQLAFWTLAQMNKDRHLDPQNLGHALCRDRIFGIGASVREFREMFRQGHHWHLAGSSSAGNGALMRIAPVLIPHIRNPTHELWGDVVVAAHLTHRDGLSSSSCLGFTHLLWEALCMSESPPASWWIHSFAEFVTEIEPETPYATRNTPIKFQGRLTEFLNAYVMPALLEDLGVSEACSRWHSGAYCLETVPSALYILARYAHDPQQAILEAVNHTKDNDTIAAIVGAAVGALHGKKAFRQSWLDGLPGQVDGGDDGRLQEILEDCRRTFKIGAHSVHSEGKTVG